MTKLKHRLLSLLATDTRAPIVTALRTHTHTHASVHTTATLEFPGCLKNPYNKK
jgi:hypothetical protein